MLFKRSCLVERYDFFPIEMLLLFSYWCFLLTNRKRETLHAHSNTHITHAICSDFLFFKMNDTSAVIVDDENLALLNSDHETDVFVRTRCTQLFFVQKTRDSIVCFSIDIVGYGCRFDC